MVNNMDRNIEYCINQMYNAGQLTETNYYNLVNALDEYHEAAERLDNCKCKYLIGEKVYVEKDLLGHKNHVGLITIESIAYDKNAKCYMYNYVYPEDELYPTEEDLLTFLKTIYYKEYEEKMNKICNDLKNLKERDDIYAKR